MPADPAPSESAPPDRKFDLNTPIQFAPGVGPQRAALFERLGVRTVADLIQHLPHRYEQDAGHRPIDSLSAGATATASGLITACRWIAAGRGRGRGGRFVARLEDDTGALELVWFNAAYMRNRLHAGHRAAVTGKVALYRDGLQMANPRLQIFGEREDEAPDTLDAEDRLRPIYPATEGLSTEQIDRVVRAVLADALPQIEDHFDEAFRRRHALPSLQEAYRMLHAPANTDEAAAARRRLAYDELLFLQLGFAIRRRQRAEGAAPPLRHDPTIDAHIRRRFPFELTDSQSEVVAQIARDLQRPLPMNRLLQGDVGSGKTVVALYALLMAVASGKQGALMAPTELLAEQHFLSCSGMLSDSDVRLALLTGSMSAAEREAALFRIERGEVDIVIGTQALIQSAVQFHDLAVVVVDEQHRFGVQQRAAIRSKAGGDDAVPHTLVMTATPIPRTLSLTMFGDLDVSTIEKPPPGRQPITTRVVPPEKAPEVYRYVAERVAAGEQAYVVLPAIDDDGRGLKAVRSHAADLQRDHFAGRTVATLHGQLKRTTRERLMHRFRAGKIDVLVATTVIEVGVDVPNATVMVVEHAERFGLAQLHQLRGRVGRGTAKSLCVFIAETPTEDAAQRMTAIGRTTDGFEIAAEDLNIRGIGEFFGTRQSGLPPLKIADLTRHEPLLRLARRDAQAIVDADPELRADGHDRLRRRLIKRHGTDLGLADVG